MSRLTWKMCLEMFDGRNRNKSDRPMAANTRIHDGRKDGFMGGPGQFVVKLHNTFILFIKPNDHHTVYAGGWQTVTTKDRIRRFSNARIYSSKGDWWTTYSGIPVLFRDGMEFNIFGELVMNECFTEVDAALHRIAYEEITRKRPQGYATYGLMENKVYELVKKYERVDARLAA